ncbi:MAG TPA: hypothetical protein VJU78_20075, partial [Chitinophagaceae bacterium]|nr:hypothetical protein [Chitinophagaceae bacterium]
MAQDLLRRIPGLEMDRSGKLSFNGRPVSKILVDGKVYFGEDGIVALANISSDMIDRIQIAADSLTNHLSNETLKNQILNLKLKAGNKYFGNGVFLAGTDKRYDGTTFGSVMRVKDRVSMYAGRNNINKTGSGSSVFTIVSRGLGITENTFAGIDFGLKIDTFNELAGSYQFNHPNTVRDLIKERRQNILSGGLLITQSLAEGENKSSNHMATVKLLRSSNGSRPVFSSTLGWNNLESSIQNTASTKDEQGNLLNSLASTYLSKGSNNNWTNEISYSKETQNWNINGNLIYMQINQNLTDYNEGIMIFYKNNAVDSQQRFRQQIETANRTEKWRVNFGVTKKMGKYFSLALNNTLGVQFGSANRITRNMDTSGLAEKIDTTFSNQFRFRNLNSTSTFSFIYKKAGWYLKPGMTLLQNYQLQKDLSRKTNIHNSHLNLVPSCDVSKLVNQSIFSLTYSANITLPTLEQLQPVQD